MLISYKLIEIRKYKSLLTQDFDYFYIEQQINLASLSDEGQEFSIYF